jgi:hypothetical protein
MAPFIDWAFPYGNAPQDEGGGSAMLSLLLSQAADWMVQLERFCGYPELCAHWSHLGDRLRQGVRDTCLDPESGWVRDTCTAASFSLHAQVEAVLAGLWEEPEARRVLRETWRHPSVLQPASLYYRHYLAMALRKAGMVQEIFALLQDWFEVLEGSGLTTFPENIANPRSDCHGWSVFPGYAVFSHIIGMFPDPDADGASRWIWQPCPGRHRQVEACFRIPAGEVKVGWTADHRGRLLAKLETPVPVVHGREGELLMPGRHAICFDIGSPDST